MTCKSLIILASVFLAGCADPIDMDHARNIYPPQCAGSLADEPGEVIFVSPAQMRGLRVGNREAWGMTREGSRRFYIDNTLMGWMREDVIKHERCHGRMFRLTGNGQWHR